MMQEGWESGLYRELPKDVKPPGVFMDAAERKRVDRACAEIAARKAMKWPWKRYLTETGSSEGSVPGHDTASLPQSRFTGSPPWTTPRRHKTVGSGLLNKTLRTTKRTRIPQPSDEGSAGVASYHAHFSSTSEHRATSENYGALPSSYRRLRKAKSMLTTRRRTMGSHESPLLDPFGRSRIPRRATSFAALPTSNFGLRLKRSLTFRSKSKFARYTAPSAVASHDEAVQMARAHFLDEEQHGMEHRQSIPYKIKSNLHHKPFSKSLETSQSMDSRESPTPTGRGPQSSRTETGKRSFSASLRDRVRRALGKSAKATDRVPPQQLEAQRSHFDELAVDTESISGFDAYCAGEDNNDRRQSVYFSSTPEPDQLEERDEMPYNLDLSGSRESLHSNTRSRVTSWTNSSMSGSIGLRSGPMERNRLSIIKEDGGPHQPSSSAGRHIGGVSLFQEPLQPSATEGRILPQVDSQRVYSALIKRIDQEEAEIERTRLAFQAITEEQDNGPTPPSEARPTIRVVHSDTSLAAAPVENQSRHFSSGSSSAEQLDRGMTPEQHRENLERRKERLAMQESQSSFFPFSSEQNPTAPSPFKHFLQEKRHHELSGNWVGHSDPDGGSIVINRDSSNRVVDRRRFGFSSESVYSRTTDGGVNERYRIPIASSEELPGPANSASETGGMATILPTVYCHSSSKPLGSTDNCSIDQTKSSDWNPWSDTVMGRRDNDEHLAVKHVREPAQIESEEARGNGERAITEVTIDPKDSDDRGCLVDGTSIPGANPVKPKGRLGVSKSHTGLLSLAQANTLNTISKGSGDGKKTGDGVRKVSPGNLAKLLREKKGQIMARQDQAGKENIPAENGDSPPMSTPGKLQLQFRNGNTTGRLRKRISETTFNPHRGMQATPHSAFSSLSTTPSRCEESPSEKAKDHLVARLSRPFNMDVPPHNRPFDSMYLGKRTPGHPDTIGNSRLSVAPRVPPNSDGHEGQVSGEHGASDLNGLPSESSTIGRSAAKVLGLFNSKRMVSNFLKSRRADRSRSESGQSMVGGSAAFI